MDKLPQLPQWCFCPDKDCPGLYLKLETLEQRRVIMQALGYKQKKKKEA